MEGATTWSERVEPPLAFTPRHSQARIPKVAEVPRCAGLRNSKNPRSLDGFLGQEFDYVISVCDRADAACPIFPGDTERIHCLEDPAAVEGTDEEKRRAFEKTATDLMRRIRLWTSLPKVAEKAGLPAVGLNL